MITLFDRFIDFQRTVLESKASLVHDEGIGVDLRPAFGVTVGDEKFMTGVCGDPLQRHTLVTPGSTRWMNLCRQIVTLTGADVAYAAVEVMVQDPADPDQEIEAIEITACDMTMQHTAVRPYKYLLNREMEWLDSLPPEDNPAIRATCQEVIAARLAWSGGQVAYAASIRHLTTLCQATWMGSPELVTAVLGAN